MTKHYFDPTFYGTVVDTLKRWGYYCKFDYDEGKYVSLDGKELTERLIKKAEDEVY